LLDLDGSDQEVKKLQELLAEFGVSAQTIQREKATKQAFIEAIGERSIDVVHYSGHAQYMGNNPSLSALYLHTDQICEACEGRGPTHALAPLTASEISRTVRFDGAPIIFLSGCETGINEIEPGDEMFGLFRSLMFAGATSFVLSRWLVNDRIAVLFAEKFYHHLYDGNCVAVALQKARTNVFEKDPDHFTHWSAFTMQGDPFRRLSTH
jgi:CHAT domain-containing protein